MVMLIYFVHERNELLLGCYKKSKIVAQVPLLFPAVFKRKSVKLPVCAKKVLKSCRTVDPDLIKTSNTDCIQMPRKDEILGSSLFQISF